MSNQTYKNKKDLITICKSSGIKDYSSLKVQEIVELLGRNNIVVVKESVNAKEAKASKTTKDAKDTKDTKSKKSSGEVTNDKLEKVKKDFIKHFEPKNYEKELFNSVEKLDDKSALKIIHNDLKKYSETLDIKKVKKHVELYENDEDYRKRLALIIKSEMKDTIHTIVENLKMYRLSLIDNDSDSEADNNSLEENEGDEGDEGDESDNMQFNYENSDVE